LSSWRSEGARVRSRCVRRLANPSRRLKFSIAEAVSRQCVDAHARPFVCRVSITRTHRPVCV
jgi:hypothetical protein